jgi:hypothetical protein
MAQKLTNLKGLTGKTKLQTIDKIVNKLQAIKISLAVRKIEHLYTHDFSVITMS